MFTVILVLLILGGAVYAFNKNVAKIKSDVSKAESKVDQVVTDVKTEEDKVKKAASDVKTDLK